MRAPEAAGLDLAWSEDAVGTNGPGTALALARDGFLLGLRAQLGVGFRLRLGFGLGQLAVGADRQLDDLRVPARAPT